jgi:FlaA1/EpsC-like NDP-sugar epimerase
MARSSLAFYQRHFPGVRWVEESKVTEEQKIIQSYADEIASLKEQLARTKKERDQATKHLYIKGNQVLVKGTGQAVGGEYSTPDLYAQLKGGTKDE